MRAIIQLNGVSYPKTPPAYKQEITNGFLLDSLVLFSVFLNISVLACWFIPVGMAAAVQPSDWLRSQVLFLPHVPGRGVHGLETVFPKGSLKQV
jgi:hypothetical protein